MVGKIIELNDAFPAHHVLVPPDVYMEVYPDRYPKSPKPLNHFCMTHAPMCLHDATRESFKMLSHKMAPGDNFGGDKLTSWVMGIPQCEKPSHIHGWTYEPFGEPKENECTTLPRIPLISSGCISCSFCISLSLTHIYI